jgi:hypothetical protein
VDEQRNQTPAQDYWSYDAPPSSFLLNLFVLRPRQNYFVRN